MEKAVYCRAFHTPHGIQHEIILCRVRDIIGRSGVGCSRGKAATRVFCCPLECQALSKDPSLCPTAPRFCKSKSKHSPQFTFFILFHSSFFLIITTYSGVLTKHITTSNFLTSIRTIYPICTFFNQTCLTTNPPLSSRTSILPPARCRALLEASLAVLLIRLVVESSMFLGTISWPIAHCLHVTYDSAQNSVYFFSHSSFCFRPHSISYDTAQLTWSAG